jgi:polysaccharide lyase-like protein
MHRAGPSRLLVLLTALALVLSASLAPTAGADRGRDAERAHSGSKRGGERAAAQRRKARQAKRRRLAALRRKRRHGLGDQVALTRRKPAATVSSDVLFRGDFESGFDGWHVQSISSRANLFSSGAFLGSGAARFEVQDGDIEPETGSERSEVSGPTFSEGQDLYFRDSIRVPGSASYDGPWQIIQQLHEEDWGGSPGIAVFLEADDSLRLGRGDGDATYWESAKLQRDRWYDLVYRVYLSRDSGAGFVEVWLDGVQQTLESGQTRAYGETIQTSQTYLKAGIYRSRSSTGTSIVDHDQLVVGTSLAAVTAG